MVTYYVVQSFQRSAKKRLIADTPQQLASADQAMRTAKRLSASKAYVVAFSRTGDQTTGDFDDAVILVSYGEAPAELSDAA